MNIDDKISEMIAKHLVCEEDEVTPEATLESLGADSLDQVELVMAVEEEFKIQIPDEDAEKLTTVGSLCAYLESRIRS